MNRLSSLQIILLSFKHWFRFRSHLEIETFFLFITVKLWFIIIIFYLQHSIKKYYHFFLHMHAIHMKLYVVFVWKMFAHFPIICLFANFPICLFANFPRYLFVCKFSYMFVCKFFYMFVCTFSYMFVHTFSYMFVCTFSYMFAYTFSYMFA